VTIELGDEVRWVPTGEIGTVLGLTTEPSAIVVFPHGRAIEARAAAPDA
jgi:hypothetical protein